MLAPELAPNCLARRGMMAPSDAREGTDGQRLKWFKVGLSANHFRNLLILRNSLRTMPPRPLRVDLGAELHDFLDKRS
jgi:hypothetical protein